VLAIREDTNMYTCMHVCTYVYKYVFVCVCEKYSHPHKCVYVRFVFDFIFLDAHQ